MTEIDRAGNENQAAIDAGILLAEPAQLDGDGRLFGVTTPAGAQFQVVDVEINRDLYRDRPRRKTGAVVVHDAASFIHYLDKHSVVETEIFANLDTQSIVAVINAHAESGLDLGDAGWGDHRLTMRLSTTVGWAAWAGLNRRLVKQLDFAEHVEDRLPDFVSPSGADMLELAQSFSAHRSVRFESSKRVKSGETQLTFKEEETAAAGKRGDMAIPDTFEIGIIPFEGSEAYKVTARLRYRITDGALSIGYILDRPEDVVRSAFLDIVGLVEDGAGRPVLRGVPA